MVFIDNLQSIGTVGRDFATHTLWEAALPADLTTGDGRTETGESHDDSDFDEVFSILGQITNGVKSVALVAAQNKTPVIKPDGLGGGPAVTCSTKNLIVDGLTVDGSLGLSSLAGFLVGATQEGAIGIMARCIAKNLGDSGFITVAGGAKMMKCLSFDNDRGFELGRTTDVRVDLLNCGAYGNDNEGFVQTNAGMLLYNCWSFANPGANYQDEGANTSLGRSCWSDDSTISILTLADKNIEIAPGDVAAHFLNVLGRNFDLAVTSAMRKGGLRTQAFASLSVGHDLGNRAILHHYGSIVDIGPFQPSLAIIPDFPDVGNVLDDDTVNGLPGTYEAALEADHKLDIKYGEDGTEFTGTLVTTVVNLTLPIKLKTRPGGALKLKVVP